MLIAGVMGQDGMKFLPMCLESLKDADKIVYIDGGSKDNSVEYAKSKGAEIIESEYNQEDKSQNGKQRNIFLKYIKDKYPNEWCLFCDCDEVVENLDNIKKFIQTSPKGLYSIKMRHFIGTLGFEDNTQQTHYALNRLFKISEAGSYPEVEHPVLTSNSEHTISMFKTDCITIWHLAYLQGAFDIKNKYNNHLNKSNIHTPEYLDNWKDAHMLGTYPTRQVNVLEIPEIILKNFNINKDKYYFANRGIELKNALMVKQWNDYFKPIDILDIGCGRGSYLFFWKWFVKDCNGLELSQYAIDNAFTSGISKGDVIDMFTKNHDLVTAIDLLEHLEYKDLDKALKNIANAGKRFLFSIPFAPNDPNLEADKTHKIKETKEWWINKLSQYFKIKDAPKDWLFANQILIGSKE